MAGSHFSFIAILSGFLLHCRNQPFFFRNVKTLQGRAGWYVNIRVGNPAQGRFQAVKASIRPFAPAKPPFYVASCRTTRCLVPRTESGTAFRPWEPGCVVPPFPSMAMPSQGRSSSPEQRRYCTRSIRFGFTVLYKPSGTPRLRYRSFIDNRIVF